MSAPIIVAVVLGILLLIALIAAFSNYRSKSEAEKQLEILNAEKNKLSQNIIALKNDSETQKAKLITEYESKIKEFEKKRDEELSAQIKLYTDLKMDSAKRDISLSKYQSAYDAAMADPEISARLKKISDVSNAEVKSYLTEVNAKIETLDRISKSMDKIFEELSRDARIISDPRIAAIFKENKLEGDLLNKMRLSATIAVKMLAIYIENKKLYDNLMLELEAERSRGGVLQKLADLWNTAKTSGCPKDYAMTNSGKCIYTGEVCPIGKCQRKLVDGVSVCDLTSQAGPEGSFICDATAAQTYTTGYSGGENDPLRLNDGAHAAFNKNMFGNKAPGYFATMSYTPQTVQSLGSIYGDNKNIWRSGDKYFYNWAPDTYKWYNVLYPRYLEMAYPSVDDIATLRAK